MSATLRTLGAAAVLALCTPLVATAETELSVYTGYQTAPHSVVTVDDSSGSTEFTAGWDGKSFEMPPYYGLRATYWLPNEWGFGAEFTHDKVYANDDTRAANGYDVLEFTDGLNILTANVMRRWTDAFMGLTPYVGAGLGIAVPHVEVQKTGGVKTYGYQYTGPAVRLTAGVKYDITETWGVFGEYQGTYSMNKADLDSGAGDTLETNIITNALNFGVSYRF
ncbi:hypothetical protein AQS8620_00008 [Aquimixticola soesokkakensis]|uniref:Outer membrane protein beta-barrel domain-containing protein n=1 Tax=Aquimixticola soesokkakensis TaxID=1519096 RepID=A0A1Y5R5U5_9RHOB|nr:outer membrane beta-barrel protein [Aquimixticola soesokkakensis]SLN09960.1 hypothetical protein AQS8620_00008 [Aquimixticola soesokkakensis]